MLAMVIFFILGIIYICKSLKKFKFKNKYTPYIIVFAIILILTLTLNFMSAIVIIIHYLIILLIMELIFLIIKKISKKNFKYYYAGIITIIIVPIYIAVGIYNAYNVVETNYSIKTNKLNEKYKISLISDSHIGTILSADKFNKYLKEIEKNNPDMILISGDFVDDDTTKEQMIKACEYLGKIKTKYGIYFSHGNHDKGYYGEKRGFTNTELENELIKNNITILKDENILINNEVYIIGRKDFQDTNRKNIDELVKNVDNSKYIIVIDHQPTDYINESLSEVDLVLSGHTHGGQLIPLNLINTLVSENDAVYGHKKIKNTDFIITSGISNWKIKIKTGCIAEYVQININ